MPAVKETIHVNVSVNVMRLTPSTYIAVANVAGLHIRGGSRNDPGDALQSFFQVLGGASGNTDDAKIAAALLVADTTLEAALLSDGVEDTRSTGRTRR